MLFMLLCTGGFFNVISNIKRTIPEGPLLRGWHEDSRPSILSFIAVGS